MEYRDTTPANVYAYNVYMYIDHWCVYETYAHVYKYTSIVEVYTSVQKISLNITWLFFVTTLLECVHLVHRGMHD